MTATARANAMLFGVGPCLLLAVLLCWAPVARAAPSSITRDKIISIAKSGVGCRYVWGGTCWNPANKKWKGADCSGYVTKCWQIPSPSSTASCLPHYYTTHTFYNYKTHWSHISRNSLLKGDALVYNSGSSGHVVIYSSGDKWGNAKVYEARGSAYGILYRTKYVSSSYKARRRTKLVAPKPAKPKYPLLTISSSVLTIKGQSRDFCTTGKSKGIFDWLKGQAAEVVVDVKNSGTAVAKNLYVGLWAEEPYLKISRWNIYTNWKKGSSFVLNDTDALQKLSHNNPGKTFKLWLGSLSVGETKRVKLKVMALKYSLGKVDHPDVRAWVSHVDNFYEKKDFWAKPNNVKGYQKQNGGNLHAYSQTDVLEQETCDGKDNDCDGKVDEGGVCSKPKPKPKPKFDSGAAAAPDSLAQSPETGMVPGPEQGLEAREDGAGQGGADLDPGPLPVIAPPADGDISGGCSMSGARPWWPGLVVLLTLGLRRRKRRPLV